MPDATPAAGLAAAHERYQGDWDADGTITVHLPVDIAEQLLRQRGWTSRSYARGGSSWTVPTGERIWHTSEAIQVALTAETTHPDTGGTTR